MLFSLLYLLFGLVFRGEEARLVLALHHQVLILQRQLGQRPTLAPSERLALVLSSLVLGKEKLGVFFLEMGIRRIIHWNASTSPDEAWVAQQFRNPSVVNNELPRCLIHDRDSKYTRHADSLLDRRARR